ncbi:universal stress protein A-like protein isoform X1 [Gossypium hirsutum]|uniref:Universal stress protein A-like protein isoform X1 n=1 Tax=Gossypium hirsutum TaxID=3635 RepID=A0ABM2ZNG1_GOSHI|nr:universal stress protein A-like protein isoform X1 [Gossypium hirsutum]
MRRARCNSGKASVHVEVLMKVYWGDPREKLCEAIDSILLSCIIVGNRGLGKLKRIIMGSVSNYVVNNGSCAVTVVKHHE